MARELGRFNPGFAGSTANLSRSNTSLNTIGNVMFVDGVSGSPYNTLQRNNIHNVNPRPQRGQNAVYDDIGPGAASIVKQFKDFSNFEETRPYETKKTGKNNSCCINVSYYFCGYHSAVACSSVNDG